MSDPWARIVGQEHAVARLQRLLDRGAAGRSYLFAGPRGVGRELAARVFAASLLCPERGCGTCRTCTRILDGGAVRHVDVTIVAPEGANILVEQIRELRAIAARSPHEGPVKVLVIQQAEAMNAASANALLKVLEEPSRDTVFVLISERPDELLDTIRSRCEHIGFEPLTPSVIRSILIEREHVDEATADRAARVGGDLATALAFVKDPEAWARRERHLEIPSRIVRGGVPAIVDIAGELLAEGEARAAHRRAEQQDEAKDLADLLGEGRGSAGAMSRLKARHKREERAASLVALDAALRDLASFYRDCLAASAGAGSATLINREDADRIARGAAAVDPAWLARAVHVIEERRRTLVRNVQPRLAIESLLAVLQTPRPRR